MINYYLIIFQGEVLLNIGIDVDGVLIKLDDYQLKYGKEFFEKSAIDETKYHIQDIFDCSSRQSGFFWIRNFKRYCMNSPATKDAAQVIKRLRNDGHKIYIITSRAGTKRKYPTGFIFRKTLLKWLKKRRIEFDKIFFCSSKKSHIDKFRVCKKIKIDIMIDDKKENIEKISKIAKVICLDAKYNKDCEGKDIYRAYNFKDIYTIIQNEQLSSGIKNTVTNF